MSARYWPIKQSILPIIPNTPVTTRLNLDCYSLNHPTRARLFNDQLENDKLAPKPVFEQVLSRRKDHTVPTKWSLYRPLIRSARIVDNLLARTETSEKGESLMQHSASQQSAAHIALTKYVRRHWKKNSGAQGYKRVRDWLLVQFELLDEFDRALQGNHESMQKLRDQRKTLMIRDADRKSKKLKRIQKKKKEKSSRDGPNPRVHPSFLAPTLFNIALPRMKPQPLSLSMMIDDRVKRRDRRRESQEQHRQWAHDMVVEYDFWKDLGLDFLSSDVAGNGKRRPKTRGRPTTGSEEGDLSFTERHLRHVEVISTYFERDAARAKTTYTPEMIDAVENARRAREQARQYAASKKKRSAGLIPRRTIKGRVASRERKRSCCREMKGAVCAEKPL
ncbi:hypothetical protein NliqN6_4795 [Naganishia liquefaciens]|uniref:Uncharacterized protein n=1 Tax=Naganishia liquefaciens TaxID=104408 RepID=A0A8H3TWJ1_9TREE|nr:hypothetical protein NliqN6_4795 [Naganishia liquefaciens]